MMNLLFSIDQKSIHLLFTCIFSVLKHGEYDEIHAYVLHSDLNEKNMDAIQEFFSDVSWQFIEVPKELFEGFPTVDRYPEQIYYRLAAPVLLPKNLDRILYLDVDTIVINSLKELYEQAFEDNLFAACSNTEVFLTRLNQIRLGIRKDKDVPYVNTGVLLMNLELLRDCLNLQDLRKFMEEKKNLLWLPDQDILTALYGERVKLVDRLKFNLSDRTMVLHNIQNRHEPIDLQWVRNQGIIVHYFGKNKPWKEDYHGVLGELYFEIAKELSSKMREYKDKKERINERSKES